MPCVTKETWVTALYSSFCCQEAGACLTPVVRMCLLRSPGHEKRWRKGLHSFPHHQEGGRGKQGFAWQDSAPEACCSFQGTWTTAGSAVRICWNEPTTNCFLCSQCKEAADQGWHLPVGSPAAILSSTPWFQLAAKGMASPSGLFLLSWGLCWALRGSWEEQQLGHPRPCCGWSLLLLQTKLWHPDSLRHTMMFQKRVKSIMSNIIMRQ